MDYKKLVSLLAVSTLALAACDTDEEPTDPENGEVEEGTEENGAENGGSDSQSLIDSATEQSGDAFPDYTVEIGAGTWTEEGYVVPAEGGEVTIPVAAGGEDDFFVYFAEEDGTVVEVVENEEEPVFSVDEPAEETPYVVGVSPEDLGGEGDTVNAEDFARSRNVIAAPEAEEEELEEE